ncbi:MAG: hypothetical protein L0H53_16630, partial [Candidatus Nitrosocosmicus sp.]|nr:hypothetical protein [Candidatus Nitrosocosmicus sp.]
MNEVETPNPQWTISQLLLIIRNRIEIANFQKENEKKYERDYISNIKGIRDRIFAILGFLVTVTLAVQSFWWLIPISFVALIVFFVFEYLIRQASIGFKAIEGVFESRLTIMRIFEEYVILNSLEFSYKVNKEIVAYFNLISNYTFDMITILKFVLSLKAAWNANTRLYFNNKIKENELVFYAQLYENYLINREAISSDDFLVNFENTLPRITNSEPYMIKYEKYSEYFRINVRQIVNGTNKIEIPITWEQREAENDYLFIVSPIYTPSVRLMFRIAEGSLDNVIMKTRDELDNHHFVDLVVTQYEEQSFDELKTHEFIIEDKYDMGITKQTLKQFKEYGSRILEIEYISNKIIFGKYQEDARRIMKT